MPFHIDWTISLGSILVLVGFLFALTKMATRSMIRDEFEKHSAAQMKVLDAVVQDSKAHAIEDNHRFERVGDRLDTLVGVLGEIKDAPRRMERIEQRLDVMDRQIAENSEETRKRFAEDRQIAHDRYEKLQPTLNRMESIAQRNSASQEQIQARMLALETIQRIAPRQEAAPESDPGVDQ